MNQDKKYPKAKLMQLVIDKFLKVGLDLEQATEVANHLVYAQAHGITSHGLIRVKPYINRIKANAINLKPQIKIEQSAPSTAIVYGDNGLGTVVANEAVKHAIKMAKETGIAAVGVKNMNHSGTMSYYLDKVAKENLIGLSMVIAEPQVAPYGGSVAYFGTNPIGFSAPIKDDFPVCLDMATSVKAYGYIMDAKTIGQKIPEGWALDANGKPTTDPNEAIMLLPFGGAKGYGIMLMINILAGLMLDVPAGYHMSEVGKDISVHQDVGQFFIVINPANFINLDQFLNDMKVMKEEIISMQPAKGYDRVRIPGQRGYELALKAESEGISVSAKVAQYLEDNTKI